MEEPRNFFSAPNLSWGFPGRSVGKESTCNAGDLGLIPGLGRFPGERNGYKIVFWPAKFHGLCSPWDHKESDMTERLSLTYPEAFAYAKSPKFECWKGEFSVSCPVALHRPLHWSPGHHAYYRTNSFKRRISTVFSAYQNILITQGIVT